MTTTPPDLARRAPEEEESGDVVVFGAPKYVRPMRLASVGSRKGAPLIALEDRDDPARRAPEETINGLAIPDDAATAIRAFAYTCRAWGESGAWMISQAARDAEGELIGVISRLATPSPARPDEEPVKPWEAFWLERAKDLAARGYVVVRREDLETLRDPAGFGEARLREAMKRTRAALTAAQQEED